MTEWQKSWHGSKRTSRRAKAGFKRLRVRQNRRAGKELSGHDRPLVGWHLCFK